MRLETDYGIRIKSRYGDVDLSEDGDQKCLHIWVQGSYLDEIGNLQVNVECNHIQIFKAEK